MIKKQQSMKCVLLHAYQKLNLFRLFSFLLYFVIFLTVVVGFSFGLINITDSTYNNANRHISLTYADVIPRGYKLLGKCHQVINVSNYPNYKIVYSPVDNSGKHSGGVFKSNDDCAAIYKLVESSKFYAVMDKDFSESKLSDITQFGDDLLSNGINVDMAKVDTEPTTVPEGDPRMSVTYNYLILRVDCDKLWLGLHSKTVQYTDGHSQITPYDLPSLSKPNKCCDPVNGGWSSWGTCGEDCTQYRSCTNPKPSCGGSGCSGSSARACSSGSCVVCGDGNCSDSEDKDSCAVDCVESCDNDADCGSDAMCEDSKCVDKHNVNNVDSSADTDSDSNSDSGTDADNEVNEIDWHGVLQSPVTWVVLGIVMFSAFILSTIMLLIIKSRVR